MILCRVVWLVAGLGSEHRTRDCEQAVGDRAQRAGMAVAPGSQRSVLGLAYGVVLDGDAGPVVECIAEARMGCEAAHDYLGLAGPPGDGSDSAQTAEGLVVAFGQRLWGLGEQRGEDGLADSGQGGEDRHVTPPAGLS